MADGEVKITMTADDSDVQNKVENTKDSFDGLDDKLKDSQKETQNTKTKFEELSSTIAKQEQELTALRGEYTEAIINFGKGSAEVKELEGKISSLNAELTENKEVFSKAKNEAEKLTDALEKNEKSFADIDDSAGQNKKSFSLLDNIIGNFVGGSLTELGGKFLKTLGSLAALSDETREYREDMAKLTSAFKTAGHSTDTAKKAYDGFYKLLGESDRSVEAVNHLAELTTNTEELAQWQTIAAGVTAKFGDSLPIEGLTEAANETAKVGAVTGPLADALNWAGISEDEFNKKLEACNSEQERATLITSTLTTEYQAAATEYNTLTASTQAAREATNRMEQAQAELGASIEPLTTWWTNAKASMLSWAGEGVSAVIEGVTSLKTNTDVLTESQRTLVNEVNARAQAYRDTKEAAAELAAAQMADVDFATNTLIPQLMALVDSNGEVKQGYEERANFILGQLNTAFGTEYTRISEIIGANGQLTQSIKDTILAKQAEILLAEQESGFKEATKNIEAEKKARDDLMSQIAEQLPKYQAAEAEKQRVYKETADAFNSGVESQVRQATIKRSKVAAEFNSEKLALDDLNAAYNKSDGEVKKYNDNIETYTTASTLIMEGKTAEAVSYLQNLGLEHEKTESKVKKSLDEQKKAVEDRLTNAAIKLGLLTEEYKTNEAKMTEAQKTEMQNRIAAAQAEVEAAGTEAKNIGSALVEGIGIGADGKADWLSGKLSGIVGRAIEAAKQAGIIKSPSRKTRDEVGKPLIQGIVVGAESEEKNLYSTMEGIITNVTDYLKKENEKQIKTIADYNKEKEAEYDAHAKALEQIERDKNKSIAALNEKLAEDKKKKDADVVKLEKEYNKDLADIHQKAYNDEQKQYQTHGNNIRAINDNIRKSISDRMTELLSLEANYQTNVKKIWADLDKSINDLNDNYNEQLKSRAESIADSLNLWDAAEKNKVNGSQLEKNLKSQVNILKNYNNAIAKLEGRGINEDFVQSLKEMGVDSTGEIEALARMTDDELADYVKLWEEKNALAEKAAIEELEPLKEETEQQIRDLSDKALEEYHRLTENYRKESVILVEELKTAMEESGLAGYEEIMAQVDDYTLAGVSLMDGIIVGIVEESPYLQQAVAEAVERAIAKGEAIAGISIPVHTDDTFSLEDYMSNLGGQITNAVDAENAKIASGGGVSRSTADAELISAVGQNNASLGSLASAFHGQTKAAVTVPINIDGREFGRAVVEFGTTEANRTGTSLSFA